ncbi:unnamed protein product [Bursaphelenchus xylophilus]|uniref:(pine wood nematode) hypothetical protein n=1 Tax=Bursaphelenchus xylophilus TaxID=6326 RepID=A0A1I7S5F2_BURXY|nr:unnamed protein product [Bursaphelenchus xylophilus]CAG9118008.1 unnamed protein product [Bursaphelenchus xylophilus]
MLCKLGLILLLSIGNLDCEEERAKPSLGLSYRSKTGGIISFLNLKAHFSSPDTVSDEDDQVEDTDFYDYDKSQTQFRDVKEKNKLKYKVNAVMKQFRKANDHGDLEDDDDDHIYDQFDAELDEEMEEEDQEDSEDITDEILSEKNEERVDNNEEDRVEKKKEKKKKTKTKKPKKTNGKKKDKMKLQNKTNIENIHYTTTILPTIEVENATSNATLLEDLAAEEEKFVSTSTVDPEDDRIMSFFGILFEDSEEDEEADAGNVTVVKDNWVLTAREILHTDSLGRSEEELRGLLSDPEKLEQTFGQAHRDHGASYLLPILKTVQYDNNSVPVVFPDIPVHVRIALNVIHLGNFDSQNMEYSIDLEMHMSWYDVRLANNYSKPIRIREKEILDLVWRPDPYFVNSKFSYFHVVSFPNFRMRVMPSGLVFYTLRATLLPVCLMTFCRHPHDHQQCDLKISSIAYPKSFVSFSWHTNAVEYNSKVTLPELRIKGLFAETCKVEGKLVSSSCLRLKINLERDGARYIVEKYIPSTLAMMFAWVAPYVPYNYEDVRIITPITVLLTLVQMEKGDTDIHTSYLTSMDIWFAAMKTFSVLSLVESLAVLALIKQSRGMEKEMIRAPNEYEREKFKIQKRRLTQLYHRLDATSRFLSPIAFIFFFVYYVLYVTQRDEKTCLGQSIFDLP